MEKEIIAEITHLARKSPDISQRSGVSVRVSIANYENILSNALKRAVRLHETQVVPRVTDLPAVVASTAGKIELETLGDASEEKIIDKLIQGSIVNVFNRYFLVQEFEDLLRSFEKVVHVDPGFNPTNAVTLRVAVPDGGKEDDFRAFYARALETLRTVPGVTAAGAIDILPLAGGRDRRIDLDGKPTPPGEQKVGGQIRNVTPGYFEAVGMRMKHGRGIEEADGPNSLPVVVVNEAFAKAYFGGDAIGHRIHLTFEDPLWTIVGVVNDVREHSLDREPLPSMFFPHAQRPGQQMTFVLRSPRPAGEVMREALASLSSVDGRLPAFAVGDASSCRWWAQPSVL